MKKENKTKVLSIRLTQKESDLIHTIAAENDMTLSELFLAGLFLYMKETKNSGVKS